MDCIGVTAKADTATVAAPWPWNRGLGCLKEGGRVTRSGGRLPSYPNVEVLLGLTSMWPSMLTAMLIRNISPKACQVKSPLAGVG